MANFDRSRVQLLQLCLFVAKNVKDTWGGFILDEF